ncbi:MAG: HlyD family secretion protein, partial [Chloroflexi bacterium]|nr:HlyD family secretion protein [Chloroflexota bacterium]
AQIALDRAIVDRERALQQWERDLADAEQSLADAERARASARLEFSNTSLEETRTALAQAQQAEIDAEEEYKNAVAWYLPPIQEMRYGAWQRAIRERELAEMRLADAEDSQGINYLDVDTREADVVKAERNLAALEDGLEPSYERAVEDAERELVKAQEALARARLVAPWAAIVLSVDIAPQADVAAGASVVTLLNVEEGLRFVTQNLSEQHIAAVYPGQRALVTLRAFPETALEGTVEAVVPQVGEAVETDARFTIHVRLAPSDLRLLPGLTGRVEIFTEN